MRHIAKILKSVMVSHFPSRRAVYNALCGFFCLRFVTLLFLDPKSADESLELNSDPSKSLIPFAQILQLLFNLQTVTDRYQFSQKRQKLILKYLAEIFNFVMDLPEFEGSHIIYPSIEESNYYNSLSIILNEILLKKNDIDLIYKKLLNNENNMITPASYRVDEFIEKYF